MSFFFTPRSNTHWQGKIALITGAGGGIGQAVVLALTQRGITCLLVDRKENELLELCARMNAMASREGDNPPAALCYAYPADITDQDALLSLVEKIKQDFGKLDILINNAAIVSTEYFATRTLLSIQNEIQTNLISPLWLTHLSLALLHLSDDPRIINTVSLGGIFPLPESAIYSASKFGLRGAMLCLGLDTKRLKVKVSNVLPSATETPMLIKEAIEGGNSLQFMDPPQAPTRVAHTVLSLLDKPRLEAYPRPAESWLVRFAMLAPNLLPRLIPLFVKKGRRGHARYLASLKTRGLIRQENDQWLITEPLQKP